VIRQSSGHRWGTGRSDVLGFAQLMMRETEIVGASDQIHAHLKSCEGTRGMTRSAGQARQPLSERSIQAFNKRGVEDRASSRTLQQLLGLRQQTLSHPPCDFDNPFFLRSLDHRANVQLRPDLQARSSNSLSPLDLLSEGSADAARIRAPTVCQHEEGTPGACASANLGHQAVGQAAITRVLDRAGQPQATRNHHRQPHPGDHVVSFHPDFIRLHMHQVKLSLLNDRLMDLLAMGSRSISPSGHGAFIQPEGMHNGLDWASIRQKRHHHHDQIHWFTHPLKHRSSTGTKRLFTRFTTIPLPFPIVDHDVALIVLASCRTRHIRAKWVRRVHWLWVCLHKPQYAYGRLLFQALLLFSPGSGVLPKC
jgi:hypothetical protein